MPQPGANLWQLPPPQFTLTTTEIHLWRAQLTCSAATLEQYQTLLSPDEANRANRFKFAEHRQRFIVGRGILRTLLGRYQHRAPQDLQFTYATQGKPSLAFDPAPLQFNLAHSQNLALYAITRDRPVGIDVEQIRPMDRLQELAERFFAPSEAAALRTLPPDQQTTAFFRYWTSKEAFLKATGIGLAQLSGVEIALPPRQLACLVSVPPTEVDKSWQLQEIDPGEGFSAAVVTTGQDWHLMYWQFPFS
jgi:4'-phosphopantetheinyl transferase